MPLANPHRLSALLAIYGLSWLQVLESLEIDRTVLDVTEDCAEPHRSNGSQGRETVDA